MTREHSPNSGARILTMTAPKRPRGRPRKPPSADGTVRYELHLPQALSAALVDDAAAAGLTVAALVRARLAAPDADGEGLRAAYRSGYQAAVREAAARIETMGREVPEVTR